VLVGVLKPPILTITPPNPVLVPVSSTPSVEVKTAVIANVSVVLLPSTTTLCPPLSKLRTIDDETVIAAPPATRVWEPRT
jgi:hypothetical protein